MIVTEENFKKSKLPVNQKLLLNVKEIMIYTGLGERKVRELLNDPVSTYTVRSGAKLYANRKQLEKYFDDLCRPKSFIGKRR